MKQRSGPSRRRGSHARHSKRVRPHFLNIDGDRVEADVKYWAIHATHWLYAILAVVTVLVITGDV